MGKQNNRLKKQKKKALLERKGKLENSMQIETNPQQIANETIGKINARQNLERKELRVQIQGLKKKRMKLKKCDVKQNEQKKRNHK